MKLGNTIVNSTKTALSNRKAKKSTLSSFTFKRNMELATMNIPTVLWIIIFSYLPMIGIIIAFKNYRYDLGIFGSDWVGFNNFKFLFTSNSLWRITRNTVGMNLLFIITGPIFSVTFGILLNEISRKFVKVYQTIMFFPHYLSWIIVAALFLGLFDMERGVLNKFLVVFGKDPVLWYSEVKYWPFILIAVNIWKHVGYGAILYYTAIIGFSSEYYEAAEIDGATRLQQVRNITLPLIIPTVVMLSLISVGNIFRADFGMFYFLTNNSSALYPATDVIDTYVFRALRDLGDISMGSAVGVFQAFVGLVLVSTVNWIVRKVDRESALY